MLGDHTLNEQNDDVFRPGDYATTEERDHALDKFFHRAMDDMIQEALDDPSSPLHQDALESRAAQNAWTEAAAKQNSSSPENRLIS